jgi:hypothetical protein
MALKINHFNKEVDNPTPPPPFVPLCLSSNIHTTVGAASDLTVQPNPCEAHPIGRAQRVCDRNPLEIPVDDTWIPQEVPSDDRQGVGGETEIKLLEHEDKKRVGVLREGEMETTLCL